MPRFLTVFLASCCTSLVVACGGDDDTAPPSSSRIPAPSSAQNANDEGRPTAPPSERDRDFSALPSPYSEADYALGRRTFKLCGSCHTLKQGAPNLVGPNLHGVIGREAGSLPGFRYSDALANASFTWSPEKLEEWLSNPRSFLPGNNMTFSGVHRPADRHAVIAYIMLETGLEDEGGAETAPGTDLP